MRQSIAKGRQWRNENLSYLIAIKKCADRAAPISHWMASQTEKGLHLNLRFEMRTLLRQPFHPVMLGGPVDIALQIDNTSHSRISKSDLSVRVSAPQPLFHPSISVVGTPCLGALDYALRAGTRLNLGSLIPQLWDGLRFAPEAISLGNGGALNAQAALFLRQNRARLPLDSNPLYLASPARGLDQKPVVQLSAEWTAAEQLPGDAAWQRINQQRLDQI